MAMALPTATLPPFPAASTTPPVTMRPFLKIYSELRRARPPPVVLVSPHSRAILSKIVFHLSRETCPRSRHSCCSFHDVAGTFKETCSIRFHLGWQLDPVSNPNAADTSAKVAGLNSIVVSVNNLCPASSNEKDVSFPLDQPLFRSTTKYTDRSLKTSVRSKNPSRYQFCRSAVLTSSPHLFSSLHLSKPTNITTSQAPT